MTERTSSHGFNSLLGSDNELWLSIMHAVCDAIIMYNPTVLVNTYISRAGGSGH